MSYCSGCGSRCQEGDRVCKSCGFKLIDDPETQSGEKGAPANKRNPKASRKKKLAPLPNSEIVASKQSTGPPAETETEGGQVAAEPGQTSETRQLQSEVINHAMGLDDVHLGKGIIKPKAIERGLDGFHFKYEEQPQAIKKGEPFIKGQGVELRVVNPEFAAELPPESTAKVDAANRQISSHSETLEVIGNAYSFKTGAKPTPLAVEPTGSSGSPTSATTVSRDLAAEEALDAMVIDSFEAELRDFETALAEVRQAETDLVLEMEAAEKGLENVLEATMSTDWLGADLGDIETIMTDTDAMVDLSAKDETAPEIEPVTAEPVAGKPLLTDEVDMAVQVENQVGLVESIPARRFGVLKTLVQGQQSWYGIPLPYYYRFTERFLVCTDPNGRSTEFDLKMIEKVTVKQSWLGKFLGIGDVLIDFTNQVPSRCILAGIANPAKLRTMLEELG